MESGHSRKHTSLRALKGHLKQTPAKVLSTVTEKHKAAGAAVSNDHQNATERIGSSLRYHDRFATPLLDYAGSLGPFFSKLPRELRDPIFSELITSGHARFMRVCQAMHIEGKDLIYKKGIFRINYGYRGMKRNVSSRTQKIADQIQHLLIRANMREIDESRYQCPEAFFRPLAPIMDSKLPRGICSVYVETYNTMDIRVQRHFLLALRALSAFETVVLRVEFDPEKGYQRPVCPYQISSTKRRGRAGDFRKGYLDMAQKELEPSLGKGVRGSGKDGLCMKFHPRKARDERVRESGQDLQAIDGHV